MASITPRMGLKLRVATASCVLLLAGACEEETPSTNVRGGGPGPASGAAAPGAAKPDSAGEAGGGKGPTEALVFKDEDFVESEHNRDPFRSYVAAFRTKGPDAVGGDPQRPVIMPTTAVESMRLIAVISGMPRPKAMLLDSLGVGYIVERGDYVGRPRVIQAAGNVQMVLNWRVDRIIENEVVLLIQNPTDPTHMPTTRVIGMSDQK